MFPDGKKLKDSASGSEVSLKDTSSTVSYNKTNKLITALYMVTDIIDRDEPLRYKLRTLGLGIISDMHADPENARGKIDEILSVLSIGMALNIVSEMNGNILRREFSALARALAERELMSHKQTIRELDLEEYLKEPDVPQLPAENFNFSSKGHAKSIGHAFPNARLGVQKGGTLLTALEKVTMSDTKGHLKTHDFEMLKKQREQDIVNVIKLLGGSATIKDIKDKINSMPNKPGYLSLMKEKTLQRELVSMVKAGVLSKAGSKRWSRYIVK